MRILVVGLLLTGLALAVPEQKKTQSQERQEKASQRLKFEGPRPDREERLRGYRTHHRKKEFRFYQSSSPFRKEDD